MAETPNGRHFWIKMLAALFIPLAVAIAGYGALGARVDDIRSAVESKASKETVDAQNAEVLRRLDRIERLLERRQ